MAAPNIVNVATITAKTAVQAVTTTPTDIVSNAGSSGTVVKLNVLNVANVNGSAAATITASVYRSSTEYKIAHVISVPAGATLSVLDKTTSIYLEEGDSLRLTASANSYLHAVCSYEILA
jgi:stress response protein SCP2